MSPSKDPTFPFFPIFSFLGFILGLIPLSWHLQAWNAGTCVLMIWTSLACLIEFINSLVWAGNVLNPAPIWCDISSKYLLGAGVGITASTLCITRRLHGIATIQAVTYTRQEKLRAVYTDLLVAVGIPLLVMILHYIVQPHRFDILEDIGCHAVIYNTLPAYFLVFQWPVMLGAISFVYSARTIRAIWKQQAQINELITFHGPSLSGRYFRLVAFALTNMILTVPVGVFDIYISTKGVEFAPWVSWSDTHLNFSRVDPIPALLWRNNIYTQISVQLARSSFPVSSFIFFVFFGFTNESRKRYRTWLSRTTKWFYSFLPFVSRWKRHDGAAVVPIHIRLKAPEYNQSTFSTVGKHESFITAEENV